MIARFLSSEKGNFAVMTTVLLVPLIGTAGLAIDYANVSKIRSHLQNAADNAALVAAKEYTEKDKERRRLAMQFFDSNKDGETVDRVTVNLGARSATVNVWASPKTYFMGIFSAQSMKLEVTSTANAPASTVEVVFALDVSGSMNTKMSSGNSRMTELKNAVSTLADKLAAETRFTTKVGYVPFTMNVNIGTGMKSHVKDTNNPLFAGTTWKGCVFEKAAPDHVRDIPNTKWNAYIWPPMPDVTDPLDWGENPSNGTNSGYADVTAEANATDFRVTYNGPNFNCVRHPIQPLTADIADFKTKVNGLNAKGNNGTLIAPGVTWALRVLSPQEPFAEGGDYSAETHKIMIVVTDGEQITEAEVSGDGVAEKSTNSATPWSWNPANYGLSGKKIETGFGPMDNLSPYGFIRDSEVFGKPATWQEHKENLVDLSDAACTEAKKPVKGQKVQVITIGVSDATAPGTLAYKALHNCASTPSQHYYVKDKSELDKVFEEITRNLKNLRITS